MNEIMGNTNYGIFERAVIVSVILAVFDFFLKRDFSLFSFVINILIFFIIFKVLEKYNYFGQSCDKKEKKRKKGNKK